MNSRSVGAQLFHTEGKKEGRKEGRKEERKDRYSETNTFRNFWTTR
jgi:hypothetical protein